MSQSALPILLAVVGVAGALGGVWLGNYLSRGDQERVWRRDHVLQAYSDVLGAVQVAQFEADAAYIMECGTQEHLNQANRVLEKVAELYRIEQRVFLLAPDDVSPHLTALASHVGKGIAAKWTACPKIPASERTDAIAELGKLAATFQNAARNDLGIHPPRHTIEEWAKVLGKK